MFSPFFRLILRPCLFAVVVVAIAICLRSVAPAQPPADDYPTKVRPLLAKYCFECHSTKKHRGDLDLERFTTRSSIAADLHPWEQLVEQVEAGEMPPKEKPQPTAEERALLLRWVRGMLGEEAKARAGDPGRVALRRLNNAEYSNTLRDLTGVDLEPAKEFPADGAAGEGFANVGDGLAMSPTLIDRYLKAAKHVAAHVVLVPEGIRFSPFDDRRRWAESAVTEIRTFHTPYSKDGQLSPQRHWKILLENRAALESKKITPVALADQHRLSPVYMQTLWDWLAADKSSLLLDRLRDRWRSSENPAQLFAEIEALEKLLWTSGKRVSSYSRYLEPREPKASLAVAIPLQPAESVVTIAIDPVGKGPCRVLVKNPRLAADKKTAIALQDVAVMNARFEAVRIAGLSVTDKHLALASRLPAGQDPAEFARGHDLDPELFLRWLDLIGERPGQSHLGPEESAIALQTLDRKLPNPQKPHILSWTADSKDQLPAVVSNRSGSDDHIPGPLRAHKVAVHPTPTEFVGIVWTSPIAGKVRVESAIKHVHTACGNGVVWWVERRRGDEARKFGKGALGLGGLGSLKSTEIAVEKGDLILAAVGPRDMNHACDLTEVELAIVEAGETGRRWDLAKDVADNIQAGNPHADGLGNPGVWRFVRGIDPDLKFDPSAGKKTTIPPGSLLAQWRDALGDPKQTETRDRLAREIRDLLVADAPKSDKANLELRAALRSMNGPLLRGLDLPKHVKVPLADADLRFGLSPAPLQERLTRNGDLFIDGKTAIEIRIPAILAEGRMFSAEIALDPAELRGTAQATIRVTPAGKTTTAAALLVPADSAKAVDDLRRLFPSALYYPNIVPVDDDGITLRHYYREDEPLQQLMLDADQRTRLDRLWAELHFVSQDAKKIHDSFDQFIGYASQVGLVPEFEPLRPSLKKAADDFAKDQLVAEPKHVVAILDFADRAYRRPLSTEEKTGLRALYDSLRKKDVSHDEAIRSLLVRVLVSPKFLYRLENPPPKTGPVSDDELATRLSYFLWASAPDAEMRHMAEGHHLHVSLREVAPRMQKSPKVRGLATEFGMQWLGVRDIESAKEKSETLFPMYDEKLRRAFFEEAAQFFEDFFRNDRSVTSLIDDDHVFVDSLLAKHYGIPGVTGGWKRVDGAHRYGRGGVLTLAAVLTKQSGASRTSPVLRGNWVVDTLLGEKLPRPPADVPQLPEAEDTSKLTVRQLVEQHTKDARCARCHVRIDPLGFSLEAFDPIGRHRTKDLAGRPIDAKATLRDGTEFDGVDGLRQYILTKRRADFERTFCRKLLGYSLGRAVMLSDGPLIDRMIEELHRNDGRVSAAIVAIVESPQFRNIRGQ